MKPLILITNDDGYESKGLAAIVAVAKEFGEVVVVAPDGPRSAVSHAITMAQPLRIRQYRTDDDGTVYYRTNGMPSDCVKLGLKVVLKGRKVDLLLSGINHGSNTSVSLLYSGTMGAAMESCVENVPSIGLSLQDYSANADFTAAAFYAKRIIAKTLENGLPDCCALNVNVPKLALEQIKGIKITRQAIGYWNEELEEHTDPYGGKYYWLTGSLVITDSGEDTCEWAVRNGYVSVQPVQQDMTDYKNMANIKYLEE